MWGVFMTEIEYQGTIQEGRWENDKFITHWGTLTYQMIKKDLRKTFMRQYNDKKRTENTV